MTKQAARIGKYANSKDEYHGSKDSTSVGPYNIYTHPLDTEGQE